MRGAWFLTMVDRGGGVIVLALLGLCSCTQVLPQYAPSPRPTPTVGMLGTAAPTPPIARAVGTPQLLATIPPNPWFLTSFAGTYPAAAQLVQRYGAVNDAVQTAAAAGVIFGGPAADGPAAYLGRSYTVGLTVYIAPEGGDPLLQLRDLLFESSNAGAWRDVATITSEALSGALTADGYAAAAIAIEGHSLLATAAAYQPMRADLSAIRRAYYDPFFYEQEFTAVQSGQETFDQLVQMMLGWTYTTGTVQGETIGEHYRQVYACLRSTASCSTPAAQ